MSTADMREGNAVSSPIRLAADAADFPSINLATLRQMSDRERMMRPGTERAKLRARIAMYLPALLDLLDETPLTPSDPGSARPSR